MGFFSRGAQPRHPRRVSHGHQRSPQPNANGSGARVAHRRTPQQKLESDSVLKLSEPQGGDYGLTPQYAEAARNDDWSGPFPPVSLLTRARAQTAAGEAFVSLTAAEAETL